MKILVDTNIITRLAHRNDAQHSLAVQATDALLRSGDDLVIVPQIHYEFWVVATRPTTVNGLGFTVPEAETLIMQQRTMFLFINDTPQVYPRWLQLVSTLAISGKSAHDARLAAAMLEHGIPRILTFNTQDFARFTSISAVSPIDIVRLSTP